MLQKIHITADYREKPSGIPDLLLKEGVNVELRELKCGDYVINNQVLIERKTKEDFVQCLVSNRLFAQCRRIKRNNKRPLLIIEGDPCNTQHRINTQAIKGAVLSISVSWQIPVLFTADKSESVNIMITTGKQLIKEDVPVLRPGFKPKRRRNRMLFFIQGLPEVGPVLALRLLDRFSTVERMINASQEELLRIEGIGQKKAELIINFIKN